MTQRRSSKACPRFPPRYHSGRLDVPACLEVSAQTKEGVVMGLHINYPVEGIQFHPESIMTVVGKQLLANFMER
jgi:anthranilate/para-aminobenzoate synthase component II